jgi:hypothetical protein
MTAQSTSTESFLMRTKLQTAVNRIEMDGQMIARLDAEIARLKALIKYVEWDAGEHGDCRWCDSARRPIHDDDCAVFTPDGKVK